MFEAQQSLYDVQFFVGVDRLKYLRMRIFLVEEVVAGGTGGGFVRMDWRARNVLGSATYTDLGNLPE
jgi:hypothetical protein